MPRVFKRASSTPLPSRSFNRYQRARSEPRPLHLVQKRESSGKGIYTTSGISIKVDDCNVQFSCYLTIPVSPLPLEWTLPLVIRVAHSALTRKMEEKFPDRKVRKTDFRVDHPELCTGSKPFFVHVRPRTDLGSLLLSHLQRCLISDRNVSFRDPFRVNLIVSFFPR